MTQLFSCSVDRNLGLCVNFLIVAFLYQKKIRSYTSTFIRIACLNPFQEKKKEKGSGMIEAFLKCK